MLGGEEEVFDCLAIVMLQRTKEANIEWLCNAARARAAPDRVAKPPPPDVYICYRVWFYHR